MIFLHIMTRLYLQVHMKSLKDFKCGWINHSVDINKGKNFHFFCGITIKASPPIYRSHQPGLRKISATVIIFFTLGLKYTFFFKFASLQSTRSHYREWGPQWEYPIKKTSLGPLGPPKSGPMEHFGTWVQEGQQEIRKKRKKYVSKIYPPEDMHICHEYLK